MNKLITKTKQCADQIASQIIELHQQGFIYDFIVSEKHVITCLQNNATYDMDQTILLLCGHGYDKRFRSYKFIYVVVTSCGLKGLLVENLVFSKNLIN
jgi:carotenoid cleavage dioxygenase-like enzyme